MSHAPDIATGRLPAEAIERNFADLHPRLSPREARVAAERCLFCYDAPCVQACPTSIDIPLFIRQIATGNPLGSAKTILDANIMGGMCARVCPTETLCEEVCVREIAEGKPVEIGRLQRYATDTLLAGGHQPFRQGPASGHKVAVVGAGPAGLACAHRLSLLGHAVTLFEARDKPGGLNEYGIAAYKTVEDFAQAEVEWILGVGGIELRTGVRLGHDLGLADLRRDFDAVFLGLGLGAVNALGLDEAGIDGVMDAVAYIAALRQAAELAALPVGRRIVVIGGGMTAVDAAVQSKLLGAEEVTIAYRRGKEHMNASGFEQDLAASKGVTIRHWLQPKRVVVQSGKVAGIELEYTALKDGKLAGTGETVTLQADQVFKAIGQQFEPGALNGSGPAIALENGRIKVDADGRTSLPKVWAGGDCVVDSREDLTVAAVAAGRDAAENIHRALIG